LSVVAFVAAMWIYIASVMGGRSDIHLAEKTVHLHKLRNIAMFDVRSSRSSTIDLTAPGPTLIVFLSGADCWSCMGEMPAWKQLSAKYPPSLFSEIFIFVRSSTNEVAAMPNNLFGPDARVFIDKTGEVDRQLDLPLKTPLTVLVEGATHHIVVAEEADNDPQSQSRFIASVDQAIHSRVGNAIEALKPIHWLGNR
jgi:hypothetical protein